MNRHSLTPPIYCIIGLRPVKVIETLEGGLDVQAYDWINGGFVRQFEYKDTIYGTQDDVEIVTKEEFDKYIASLQKDE